LIDINGEFIKNNFTIGNCDGFGSAGDIGDMVTGGSGEVRG